MEKPGYLSPLNLPAHLDRNLSGVFFFLHFDAIEIVVIIGSPVNQPVAGSAPEALEYYVPA